MLCQWVLPMENEFRHLMGITRRESMFQDKEECPLPQSVLPFFFRIWAISPYKIREFSSELWFA